MGYDIVHRPVEALARVERTTRPGPFEGNSAFNFNFEKKKKNNNVESARPGPLNVNDIFVIFCNKIKNKNKENSIDSNSFATLEQDVAHGLARGFATQVEAEAELSSHKGLTSSSVKRHLGAFLHSALPSRPTLPSSWPSVEVVPSWATTTTLSSALAGVVTNIVVPRWVAVFAAQLVGNELLYAVYLWATKDSLPPPPPCPRPVPGPSPPPHHHHHAPGPALTLRRFVNAALRRGHNVTGQPAAAAVAVFQAPVVVAVPQQPAAAAVFQAAVVVAQQPTTVHQAAVVVALSRQAAVAVAVLQAAVVVAMTQQAAAETAAARERDAGLRAHIA
ncbi:uncharacterized protein ACA1_383680 [Acanthamoeba castellanii str. Neff]|uniref:Uncharacterized protein n=1 Tax=Acanthamoeba castellanii (strain ATCC 30010 / Neff) TaxID=1257118 RepID=L8GV05_ACACF|nr:uncharacterized protein ACA1_383680 [Acanthamoeba castellanii str. Neff]ELR16835.1 hypothetical protein ACA1_383680 [Acanthamoeba castellanii str. Neff]